MTNHNYVPGSTDRNDKYQILVSGFYIAALLKPALAATLLALSNEAHFVQNHITWLLFIFT